MEYSRTKYPCTVVKICFRKPLEAWKSENYKSLCKALSFPSTLSFKTDSFHKPYASLNPKTFHSLFIFYICTILCSRETFIYNIYGVCMCFFMTMERLCKERCFVSVIWISLFCYTFPWQFRMCVWANERLCACACVDIKDKSVYKYKLSCLYTHCLILCFLYLPFSSFLTWFSSVLCLYVAVCLNVWTFFTVKLWF